MGNADVRGEERKIDCLINNMNIYFSIITQKWFTKVCHFSYIQKF